MKPFSYAYFAIFFVFLSGCTVRVVSHPAYLDSDRDSNNLGVYHRFRDDVVRMPARPSEYRFNALSGCNGKMGEFDTFVYANFHGVRRISFVRAPSGLQRPGYRAESSYEAEINGALVALRYQCAQQAGRAVAIVASYPMHSGPAQAELNHQRAIRAAEERRAAQEREREDRENRVQSRNMPPPPAMLAADEAMRHMLARRNNGGVVPPSGGDGAPADDSRQGDNTAEQRNSGSSVRPSGGVFLIKHQPPQQNEPQRPQLMAQQRPPQVAQQRQPVKDASAEYDPNMTVTTYAGPSVKTVNFTSTATGQSAPSACNTAKTLALAKVNDKLGQFVSAGARNNKGYGKGGTSTGSCTILGARDARGNYRAKVTAVGYITEASSKKAPAAQDTGRQNGHKP